MRSRKQFSTTLLVVGMVAMLSFSWLPMRTEEVLAAPDKFAMLSFSWLPMRTEEVLTVQDKFGIEEIYPTTSNGSVWYLNNEDPQSDGNFYFTSLEDIGLDEEEDQGEFKMDAETGTQEHGVRIHVDSPKGQWKNVEMSGYFKLVDGEDEFTMIAR